MIARLAVETPFLIVVPEGAQYPVLACKIDGYEARFLPPVRSADRAPDGQSVAVNDQPAFFASVVRIDFLRPDFDRRITSATVAPTSDPPPKVISEAIELFIRSFRYVTNSPVVRDLDWPMCPWRLDYVNDDGMELEAAEGLYRARGGQKFRIEAVTLDPVVWEDLSKLPIGFSPPPWHDLLLDAQRALPHVGSAVVLAATALEVLIGRVVDDLAAHTNFAPDLWKWLNNHRDWLKEPSVEEQFDVLLKHFTGSSLKDDADLWQDFTQLKRARNSFVHEGVAVLGKNKIPITLADASRLISSALKIAAWVRTKLPAPLQWPTFEHRHLKVEISQRLFERGTDSGANSTSATIPTGG